MTATFYRAAVKKALRSLGVIPDSDLDSATARVVDYMEIVDEAAGMGGVLIQTLAPQVQDSVIVTGGNYSPAEPSRVDISTRVVPTESLTDSEIEERKASAREKLKIDLPEQFNVKPPGFTTSIPLQLTPIQSSPGAMPFLKVTYVPVGATSEQQFLHYSINVTEDIPTSDAIVSNILQQANNLFSATPRRVETRTPTPYTLTAGDPGALSDTTDDDPETLRHDAAQWNKDLNTSSAGGFRSGFGHND